MDDDKTRTHRVLTAGVMVAHYRIIEKIGAGGMGEVYLAEDTKLNRRVALKFLPAHLAEDSEVRTRFTREAQAAAKLDHPNIVTVYEVSEFEGRPFFAMQYVDGHPLNIGHESLTISTIVSLVTQIAEGLSRAHKAGVIHRDIKSANILLDNEHHPKLLDFGLATIQGTEMLTKTGSTLGTVAYMSPEQAQGIEIDHRSDIFSLGVVIYELITGRTPFKKNSDAATLHAIISEAPEPLARYKAEASDEIQRIVSKCLAKQSSERYQSAADLAADLRALDRSMSASQYSSSESVKTAQPSIAVLPFANMSADKENEYFSDGLTEELLNVLAKNPELKVTGRTSSFAFKGKQEDLREIGRKLGVSTILEGSVRKGGNRVRITAQLVNASDGFHLWTETYDRVLDDIFAVQDDIATAVGKALHITLLGKSIKKTSTNPESYELTLKANQFARQWNATSLNAAVELYQKAIALDSENARAWAGLSLTFSIMVAYGFAERKDQYAPAKEAALKAIALDEELPEGHQALAYLFATLESDPKKAREQMRKALELAPNSSSIVSMAAISEGLLGDEEEALRLTQFALMLDPLNPVAHFDHGRVLFGADDLDGAVKSLRRVIELSPDMTPVNAMLSGILCFQGKFNEALSQAEKEKLKGYRECCYAIIYSAMGRQEESDRALVELEGEGNAWAIQMAFAHACRKENDKAFEWLERAYETRDSGLTSVRVTPFLRNLRSDPRWIPFLKKIGLAD